MKKMRPPNSPMPAVYSNDDKNTNEDITNDDLEQIDNLNDHSLKQITDYDDLPNKQIFNYNLKKLKSFRNIRKSYKIKNQKNIFLQDLTTLLKEYPPQDFNNQLNDELLVEIMNIAEQYFFYGTKEERNENKKECVVKLMLKYFRNDNQLLLKTMQLVKNRVKKSTRIQRVISRLKYFFLIKD